MAGAFVHSQDVPAQPPPEAATAETGQPDAGDAAEEDLVLKTLPLDIASASYYSLVAWARELGLPETGSADELRGRLYQHYGVQKPESAAAGGRTIVIESADKTSYVSAASGGEALVELTGGVTLVVNDDAEGVTIRLSADRIVLNQDAGILSARGNVMFERERSGGTDYFMGELLDLDLDDQSGLFLDGVSERGSDEERMSFRADDIESKGSNVLVFSDGVISSCNDEHPHYSIRASKIWILGGNEWAIANATLSVGEVPVLYLPFFYYPGEEIVFHPVFGYDPRTGRYIQTTTYLVGDKPAKEESISLFKLTDGGQGYEREVEGVFLRTTQAKKGSSSSDFVKVFADLYTGLGAFAGAEAKYGELGAFRPLSASLGLGFSRTLFPLAGGTYTPFVSDFDYESVWNSPSVLGADLPLRFGLELTARTTLGPVGLSFSLPFYTDPYFDVDFKARSEDMDWLDFLGSDDGSEAAPARRGSFVDRLDIQLSVPAASLPSWLSTVSLQRLSSSLNWLSKTKSPLPALEAYDPEREFFYPDQFTYVDTGIQLGGTVFSYPRAESRQGGRDDTGLGDALAPEPVQPWVLDAAETPEKLPATEGPGLPGFTPPGLATVDGARDPQAFTSSLTWSLGPQAKWDRRFKSSDWLLPEDVDLAPLYELVTARVSGALNLSADVYGGLAGGKLSLSGSSSFQERPVADTADATLLDAWAVQDAQARADKLSGSLSLRASPFISSWLWSATSLRYALDGVLYEYAYTGMNAGEPEYETRLASWSPDSIKAHNLGFTLGIKPLGLAQTLTLSANLPPLAETYSGALALNAGFGSLSVATSYARPTTAASFAWKPLTARLTLGTAPRPVLSGNLTWDLEQGWPSSLGAKFSWDSFNTDLVFKRAIAYEFVPLDGWVAVGAEDFRPSELSMSYSKTWNPDPVWKNRVALSFSLSASARQSFLRFSDSSMNVSATLTFKIHEFLDLSFSATSRNSSLWRYYPGVFDLNFPVEPVNPLEDILKSFSFWSDADRQEALFKLKSLSLRVVHNLHDWDLSAELSVQPVLVSATASYEFLPTFSMLIAWKPVPEIQSSYKYDGATDTETWD